MSSISGLSASYQSGVNQYSQGVSRDKFSQDIQALGQAVNSGNLEVAKNVYSKIQEQSTQSKAQQTNADTASLSKSPYSIPDTIQQDLYTLSNALHSGDSHAAQAAYAKIQQELQIQKSRSSKSNAQDDKNAQENNFAKALQKAQTNQSGDLKNQDAQAAGLINIRQTSIFYA